MILTELLIFFDYKKIFNIFLFFNIIILITYYTFIKNIELRIIKQYF